MLVCATLSVALLALVYDLAYVNNRFSVNLMLETGGWWNWWDQSKYLKSAHALASADLRPSEHWYPFGYSLLATPFIFVWPQDPFYPVNFISFLALAIALVRLGIGLGLGPFAGVAAFVLGVLPADLFVLYVVPWSTTPVAALYVGILVVYVATVREGLTYWRSLALAAGSALVGAIRPTDAVALAPIFVHLVMHEWRRWGNANGHEHQRLLRSTAFGIAAAFFLLGLYLLLHLAVYGTAVSEYSRVAAAFGLDPSLIPLRYFLLFNSPRDFYGDGLGILEKYPLLVFGIFGLVYSLMFCRFKAIPLVVMSSLAIYLSFVDFLPSGLWRYANVHYLKWTFPVMVLLAFKSIGEVVMGATWVRAGAAFALVAPLTLLGVRGEVMGAVVVESRNGKDFVIHSSVPASYLAIRFKEAQGSFHSLYFDHHQLEIGNTTLSNTYDFRGVLLNGQANVVLHRPQSFSLARFRFSPDDDLILGEFVELIAPRLAFSNLFCCGSLTAHSMGR